MSLRTLEFYDLDGTLGPMDVIGALEGRNCPEIQVYIQRAAQFISDRTGIAVQEVFDGIKSKILSVVFPNRARLEYWGDFDQGIPITPAVDHFQLTAAAITVFLKAWLQEHGETTPTGKKVKEFLASPWKYSCFTFANKEAALHAEMEEDARAALSQRLQRNALIVIGTNSHTEKAEAMLKKAGFGDSLESTDVMPGRICVVGDMRKHEVDRTWSDAQPASFDLSRFYREPIQLDVRRRIYRQRVRELYKRAAAQQIVAITDIPELDLYPLRAEFGARLFSCVRKTPTSAPASMMSAHRFLHAYISPRVSRLVEGL